jgi:hypothetical protein
MTVSLTIITYRRRYIFFALSAMGIFRLPLWMNKHISFYKLLGTGKNGTFDKDPDWKQWGILAVHSESLPAEPMVQDMYGKFIAGWLRFFKCELKKYLLEPLEGHGSWDNKKPFGDVLIPQKHAGRIAVLTRATIKLSKLKYFWTNVAPVAAKMKAAKGFINSYSIGEVPWVKQATFSTWESKEDMIAFAYGMKEHAEVIKKTRQQKWYSEELFMRFKIIGEFIRDCQGDPAMKRENPNHNIL